MATKKNKRKSRAPLMIGLALIVAAAIASFAMMSGSGGTIAVSPAPVLTNSVSDSLAAYRGKVVILDFWATWCGPCRSEIPGLITLQDKYRDQGVEIIGVSLDPITGRGTTDAVEPFMRSNGINYNIWMVNNAEAINGYDVSRGIPTKYILDREGRVVKSYIGARPTAVVEDDIKELL